MKDIKNYEGLYGITEDGKVWSYRNNKFLSAGIKGGYEFVVLSNNGYRKNYYVHRLVAEAYIDNPNNLSTVNHKDENRTNNCVDNLEWLSRLDNLNYGTRGERSCISNSKKVLCVELKKVFDSVNSAATALNLHQPNISACCKGRLKTTGGYHWEYVEKEDK